MGEEPSYPRVIPLHLRKVFSNSEIAFARKQHPEFVDLVNHLEEVMAQAM